MKMLGAGNDDEYQPQREREPAEEAQHSEWHVGASGGHGRGEDRPERDERACENGERERVRSRHTGFDDADLLRLACHLDRGQRVQPRGGENALGHWA